MLQGRCPRCRKGIMFPKRLISAKALEMNETCDNCNLRYEVQPGFFYGAMYINYAFVVAIFAIQTTLLYLLDAMDTIWLYLLSPITCVLMLPIIYRTGRILFLHLFGGVSFDESKYASENK